MYIARTFASNRTALNCARQSSCSILTQTVWANLWATGSWISFLFIASFELFSLWKEIGNYFLLSSKLKRVFQLISCASSLLKRSNTFLAKITCVKEFWKITTFLLLLPLPTKTLSVLSQKSRQNVCQWRHGLYHYLKKEKKKNTFFH